MSWRYGVIRTITEVETDAASDIWHDENIHEIYFNAEGEIVGWTLEPAMLGVSYVPDDDEFKDETIAKVLLQVTNDLRHEQPVIIMKDGEEWPGKGYSLTTQTS